MFLNQMIISALEKSTFDIVHIDNNDDLRIVKVCPHSLEGY